MLHTFSLTGCRTSMFSLDNNVKKDLFSCQINKSDKYFYVLSIVKIAKNS